jgi:hypothetical protein
MVPGMISEPLNSFGLLLIRSHPAVIGICDRQGFNEIQKKGKRGTEGCGVDARTGTPLIPIGDYFSTLLCSSRPVCQSQRRRAICPAR